jgi:DNA polymerase-3 subunit delta
VAATQKPLLAAYLFNGDDELKRKAMLEALTRRIADLGDLSFNMQVFAGDELRVPGALLDALNTLPFASPLRLVVLKEVDSAPKAIQEALVTYLATPAPTTVLAMTAQGLAKNTRLYKALAALSTKAIVDCSTKRRSELPELAAKMAAGYGATLSRAAGSALIDRTGTSTISMDNEIRKLASIVLAAGRSRIEEHDVQNHVPRMIEPKPWDLTDALALRDLAACLQLLSRIRAFASTGTPEQNHTRFYAQCLTKIREILTVKALSKRGETNLAGAMKRPEWQLRTTIRGAQLYSEKELVEILRQAPATEMRMKSRPNADMEFERWLIDVCRTKRPSVGRG